MQLQIGAGMVLLFQNQQGAPSHQQESLWHYNNLVFSYFSFRQIWGRLACI